MGRIGDSFEFILLIFLVVILIIQIDNLYEAKGNRSRLDKIICLQQGGSAQSVVIKNGKLVQFNCGK